MEDERPKLGDIGPLLPDASDKAEDKKLYDAATNKFPSSIKPVTVTYEDNLDFGGYQPSCVGKSPPSAGRRRIIPQQENKTATESKSGLARVNGIGILGLNSCSDIFTPKSGDNKNESTATQPKPEKMKDDTTAFWEQPCGPFHEDSMDAKDVSKRSFQTSPISSPLQQTEMLKAVHARELEAKDNQLAAERTLLIEHKSSIEKLSELIAKAHEWSTKVVSLEEAMFMEREHSNNDKHKWLDSLEKACHEQQASLQEWGRRSDDIFKKVEGIVATLEKGTKETEKDHINLQSLQEAVQAERLQSLAEVTTAREKLEEVRNSCYQEKEEFLMKIMQERKEIETERETVLRMKEQLIHADAVLEKQLLEHTMRMQTEAEEISKQKLELEKAKEMAAEIAHEMENGRHDLEVQHTSFGQDVSHLQGYEPDATLEQGLPQRYKDGVDGIGMQVHDMSVKVPRYHLKENEIPRLLSVLSEAFTPRNSALTSMNASGLLQNNLRSYQPFPF